MQTHSRSHRHRWIRTLALACAAGMISAGCKGDGTTAVQAPVASVAITGAPSDGIILVGQTAQLATTIRDAAGVLLTGRTVAWSTSNAAVASVSTGGLVSAVGGGPATITATAGGQSATVDISARVAVPTPAAGATQPVTSTVLGGAVTLTVPPGAVAAGTTLNVAPAAAASVPASSQLVAGSAYVFGPEGTQFATPVTLVLQFDPTGLSTSDRAGLGIYLVQGGDWVKVAGSTVSGTANTVSAPITHLSTYAVLKRADAASISVSAGNGQSALAGTAVAVRPAVTVLDAKGRGIEGVSVQFAVATGGGSITGGSQLTSASGVATVGSWTLGPAAGPNTLTATVAGLAAATVSATATAPPAPLIRLSATSASFSYSIGNAAPPSQTLTVTNGGGAALSDLSVGSITFTGGVSGWLIATLSSASAPSTLTLTLVPGATQAGTYAATVTIRSDASSNSPQSVSVTFTVVSSAARRLAITTQPAGTRNGTVFDTQPVVEIRDLAGTKVSDATNSVTVSITSGDGVLEGTTTVTAVGGVARFTNLKITGSGFQMLAFESGALAPATSASFFLMTGVPTALVIQGGNNQTAVVSTALGQPITVRVSDIDGFGVPGVTVTWTVTAGDGSLSSSSSMTDAAGTASNVWTLGPAAGTQTVSAAVVGTVPVTFTATATALIPLLQSLLLR